MAINETTLCILIITLVILGLFIIFVYMYDVSGELDPRILLTGIVLLLLGVIFYIPFPDFFALQEKKY